MLIKVMITFDDSETRLGDLSGIPGAREIQIMPDPEPQLAAPAIAIKRRRSPPTSAYGRGFNVKAVLSTLKTGPKHYSVVEKVLKQPAGMSSLLARQVNNGFLSFDRASRMITITEVGLAHLAEMEGR